MVFLSLSSGGLGYRDGSMGEKYRGSFFTDHNIRGRLAHALLAVLYSSKFENPGSMSWKQQFGSFMHFYLDLPL